MNKEEFNDCFNGELSDLDSIYDKYMEVYNYLTDKTNDGDYSMNLLDNNIGTFAKMYDRGFTASNIGKYLLELDNYEEEGVNPAIVGEAVSLLHKKGFKVLNEALNDAMKTRLKIKKMNNYLMSNHRDDDMYSIHFNPNAMEGTGFLIEFYSEKESLTKRQKSALDDLCKTLGMYFKDFGEYISFSYEDAYKDYGTNGVLIHFNKKFCELEFDEMVDVYNDFIDEIKGCMERDVVKFRIKNCEELEEDADDDNSRKVEKFMEWLDDLANNTSNGDASSFCESLSNNIHMKGKHTYGYTSLNIWDIDEKQSKSAEGKKLIKKTMNYYKRIFADFMNYCNLEYSFDDFPSFYLKMNEKFFAIDYDKMCQIYKNMIDAYISSDNEFAELNKLYYEISKMV